MARNGSGTMSVSQPAFVFDTVIDEVAMNANFADIAAEITNSLALDGQSTMTGDFKAGAQKLTGLGVGTLQDDGASLRQIQAGAYAYVASDTGSANNYAIAPAPAIAAYAAGQPFWFIVANANTGASVLNVSALGDKAVEINGSALTGGEMPAGLTGVIYDGTAFQLIFSGSIDIQGPASSTADSLVRWNGVTGRYIKDGAVIGTDVQAYNAALGDVAGITGAQGDVLYFNGTNWVALAPGTADHYLQTKGAAANPVWAAVAEQALPTDYFTRLGTAQAVDFNHDITVFAGACRSALDDANILLSANMTKRGDATWASGDGNGGLSSSLTTPLTGFATNTWYHCFVIIVSGAADVGFDTDIDAANLIADHSATAYRRVCSFKTDGSSDITDYTQYGQDFYWDTPVNEYAADPGTSGVAEVLAGVPTGVSVKAILAVGGQHEEQGAGATTNEAFTAFYPTNVSGASAARNGGAQLHWDHWIAADSADSHAASSEVNIWTDLSATINHISSADVELLFITTLGWHDTLGGNL